MDSGGDEFIFLSAAAAAVELTVDDKGVTPNPTVLGTEETEEFLDEDDDDGWIIEDLEEVAILLLYSLVAVSSSSIIGIIRSRRARCN